MPADGADGRPLATKRDLVNWDGYMRGDADTLSRNVVTTRDDIATVRGSTRAAWRTAVLPPDNALVRILVLDRNPQTPQQIENALWIWPHRIAVAGDADSAVRMCQHLAPAALVVAPDFPADTGTTVLSQLRAALPSAVIIALGNSEHSPNELLDLGASAVLSREELQRPTLYDLLIRLGEQANDEHPEDSPAPIAMALPWRDSQIIGSLTCDVRGIVYGANECLARWLHYSSASELKGKCVWRDILSAGTDWSSWRAVAGDMAAMLHQSVAVRAQGEQMLWMNVEVFAAPNSPTDIQAIFVDQSELAHLTGRSATED